MAAAGGGCRSWRAVSGFRPDSAMAKRVWSRTLGRRSRVLKHARALARSGRFEDHRSIVAVIRELPDARLVDERWFGDPRLIEQLGLSRGRERRSRSGAERLL